MSTASYYKTAGDLIEEALRAATITGSQMPVEPSDFAKGFTALNDVLKFWQTKQIHLWSETEAFLPLNINQQKYKLGIGGDHCFTDYVYTTASASAISGATVIVPVTTAGMTVGDFIGIELSTGSRQWTTISILSPFTLAAPLSSSILAGATIYTYTTKIDQPVRVLSFRYADNYTASELPIEMQSRQEYYDTTNKDTNGSTNTVYYSRQLGNGYLSVWPVSNNVNNILRFTFIKPQYIPEDQSENILIPDEFYLALKWNVAAELGTIYVIDPNRQVILEAKAKAMLDDALSTDVEVISFSVQPSYN
jgi:hypothetical protein